MTHPLVRVLGAASLAVLLARGVVLTVNAVTMPILRGPGRFRAAADAQPSAGAVVRPAAHTASVSDGGPAARTASVSGARTAAPADADNTVPGVAVLVPARNESTTLPHTLPGLIAQDAGPVTVLNDNSADTTATVAAQAGATVVEGTPLPSGWTGKNWACTQLAERAVAGTDDTDTGADAVPDYLLFTDADVSWAPGALTQLLNIAARTSADLVTVFPRQHTVTPGERLITPLIDAAVIGLVPTRITRAPAPIVANGQVMLFRTTTYHAVGGHAAVASELVEDVRLAQRVRDSGGRVVVCRGGDGISVRMYDGYRSSIAGLAKSVPGLHGDRRGMLVVTALVAAVTWTLPWLLPASRTVWLARLAGLADRGVVSALTGRRDAASLAEAFLGPISPLLALPVYLRAFRGRLSWKGRTYP
ncbi:MAG: glycosyltransferase [Mycetocola sp.]